MLTRNSYTVLSPTQTFSQQSRRRGSVPVYKSNEMWQQKENKVKCRNKTRNWWGWKKKTETIERKLNSYTHAPNKLEKKLNATHGLLSFCGDVNTQSLCCFAFFMLLLLLHLTQYFLYFKCILRDVFIFF